jgi:hypothetical protein
LISRARLIGLTAVPLLAAVSVVAVPTVASAAACSTNNKYYLTSKTGSDNVNWIPPSSGSPGSKLQITMTVGATITATFTGALTTEESAIVASAKQTIQASIALALTASASYTYGWDVPTNYGKTGYLHVGAQRDIFNWKYGYYNPPACTSFTVIRHGTSHAPWNMPYTWHGSS